jgi:hypothetical protein
MKNMKTIFHISLLALLLGVAASPSFALQSTQIVSKEMAKAIGLEMRFKANGPNQVRVELEFKAEGILTDFNPERLSRVDLGIAEGEQSLVTAALQVKRPSPGHVAVSFDADPAYLEKITLTVVMGEGGRPPGANYIIRVWAFMMEPEKVR